MCRYISVTSHPKREQNHLQDELWRLEQLYKNYGFKILLIHVPKMYLQKIGEIEQKLKEEMQKSTATQIHGIFAAARGLKLKKGGARTRRRSWIYILEEI